MGSDLRNQASGSGTMAPRLPAVDPDATWSGLDKHHVEAAGREHVGRGRARQSPTNHDHIGRVLASQLRDTSAADLARSARPSSVIRNPASAQNSRTGAYSQLLRTTMPRTLIAPALAVALVGVSLAVQAATGTPQDQRPTFKARTDIVRIDVTVLGPDGKPVHGLAREEFTILENGKPREILGFGEVNIPDATTMPPWYREVRPDVRSAMNGRVLIFVLDDAQTPYCLEIESWIKTVKRITDELIDRMGPQDVAAVICTYDNRCDQDFTTDHERLKAAIAQFRPKEAFIGLRVSAGITQSVAKYLKTEQGRRRSIDLRDAADADQAAMLGAVVYQSDGMYGYLFRFDVPAGTSGRSSSRSAGAEPGAAPGARRWRRSRAALERGLPSPFNSGPRMERNQRAECAADPSHLRRGDAFGHHRLRAEPVGPASTRNGRPDGRSHRRARRRPTRTDCASRHPSDRWRPRRAAS